MRVSKSIISAALALAIILGILPIGAYAAETAAGTVRMQVTSASAQPGGTVDVVITVSENPGIASLKFDVAYDNCLTLTNVELGSNFGSYITTPVPYANPQPITVISPLQDVAGTGVLATLTFAVGADAEDGYAAGVRITHDPDDVFNGTNAPVTLSAENGTVFVYHKLPGDVNGDGKLNPKDPVALFRYVAGWPEAVDEDALDYNGDSKINTKDAIDLFRYVAGWEGIVGHRHVHVLTFTEAKAATCAEDGNIGYYHCANCNKYYTDAEGENQVSLADTVVPAVKHVGFMEAVEAKAATCTEDGNTAYWHCAKCDKYFSDAQGETVIEQNSAVLTAKGHAMTKVTENAATCTQTGNITYWHCNTCGKNFLEESGKTEIKIDDTVIEATGHITKSIAAKDATCTENGNIAYWQCVNCSLYFADEKATQQIQLADTIVPAKGHGAALKKIERNEPTIEATGNEAYWKCEVCGKCYSDQAAKNEIEESTTVIPAKSSYVIIFKDDKNHPDGKAVNFAVDEYVELASPSEYDPPAVPGYEFKGWYTSKTYAESNLVDNIPKNSKQEGGVTTLYAKWDKILYTITYKNAADNTNPPTYTVEDRIVLADPEWTGLKFDRWIDENGNEVTEIQKGSTGNITLEACWSYKENYAVTGTKREPVIVVKPDEDLVDKNGKRITNDLYYLVYEVGTVYNVPMDYISESYRYEGLSDYSKTYSKTLNVGESSARSASFTAASSYASSEAFTTASTEIKESSKTTSQNFKLCPEIEVDGISVKMYEYENGKNTTTTNSLEEYTARETGTSFGSEIIDELSSTVSYYYDVSTSVSETMTLTTGSSPVGRYRLAWVSDFRVYAVVSYNPETGDYGVNIYSMALNRDKATLYTPDPLDNLDVKISKHDQLNYNLPIAPGEGDSGDASGFVESIVNASFYVKYEANGGTGSKMPISVGDANGTVKLLNNTYSKTGWHFTGWDYAHGDVVGSISGDGSTITNPLGKGDTLVLKAHWEPNTYSVTYDANGGSGTTATSKHTYGTASTLKANGFSRTGYTFQGWSTDKAATAATYANKASVKNLTSTKDGTVKLYAIWKANTYTVTFKANGGSGSDKTQSLTYDKSAALTGNPFTRTNYVFLGWSTSRTAITATYKDKQTVTNLAASGNVTLYAVWVKTTANIAFTESNGSRNKTLGEGETYTEVVSTGMDKAALTESGYTKIQITVKFDAKRSDPIMYNNAVLRITSGGTTLGERTWDIRDHFDRTEWTQDIEKTIEVSISDLGNDISFALNWSNVDDGTWSKSEEWYLGETNVTVTAK